MTEEPQLHPVRQWLGKHKVVITGVAFAVVAVLTITQVAIKASNDDKGRGSQSSTASSEVQVTQAEDAEDSSLGWGR